MFNREKNSKKLKKSKSQKSEVGSELYSRACFYG